jgi:hypothetical protein
MQTKPTRRLLSSHDKARLLEACDRSGLTRKAFAVQQGIGLSSLYQWQRLRRVRAVKAAAPKLIEVPNLMPQTPVVAPYRLHLPGGGTLEVARRFDPSEVRVLVQLLQSL